MIDKVHVMHARRASCHAGQAREASVDVLDRIGSDFAASEHVLDEVDASARTIELISEEDICRAGRGAKPAVGARPQYLFGLCGIGIGKLF
jgi:hypothetical protein